MHFRQGDKLEVWQAVKNAGMDKDISKISEYFDISDIAVINNGECVYLNNKPRKYIRIAVATASGKDEVKAAINSSKVNQRRYRK